MNLEKYATLATDRTKRMTRRNLSLDFQGTHLYFVSLQRIKDEAMQPLTVNALPGF